MLTGSYVDAKAGRKQFKIYAEEWRKIQQHKPTTAEQVETYLRRHAYTAFGDRPINSIRPSELQAWVKGLESSLAPATIEVVMRHVSSVFKAAVRDRLIAVSYTHLTLPTKA